MRVPRVIKIHKASHRQEVIAQAELAASRTRFPLSYAEVGSWSTAANAKHLLL